MLPEHSNISNGLSAKGIIIKLAELLTAQKSVFPALLAFTGNKDLLLIIYLIK